MPIFLGSRGRNVSPGNSTSCWKKRAGRSHTFIHPFFPRFRLNFPSYQVTTSLVPIKLSCTRSTFSPCSFSATNGGKVQKHFFAVHPQKNSASGGLTLHQFEDPRGDLAAFTTQAPLMSCIMRGPHLVVLGRAVYQSHCN